MQGPKWKNCKMQGLKMHLHQTLFNPTNPQISKEKFFQEIFWKFSRQFSLSFLYISLPKTHQNNHKVVFLLSIFLSLALYLGFEVQGCGCSFLAKIHTHFFSQHILALSCFLASSMVFFFFSMFPYFLPCFNAFMLFAKPSWVRINLNFVFVLRSTCVCAPCHAFAQIYMFMCSLPCLCLDLHVYVLFGMFLLRCVSLSALCHVHVSRSTC